MRRKGGEKDKREARRTRQTGDQAQSFALRSVQDCCSPSNTIQSYIDRLMLDPTVAAWIQPSSNSTELYRDPMTSTQGEWQETRYNIDGLMLEPTVSTWIQPGSSTELYRGPVTSTQGEWQEPIYPVPSTYNYSSEILKFVTGQPLMYMNNCANEPSTSGSQGALQEYVPHTPYYDTAIPSAASLWPVPQKSEKLKHSVDTILSIPTVVSDEYKGHNAIQMDSPSTDEPQPSTSGYISASMLNPVQSSQQECNTTEPASTSTVTEDSSVVKYVSIPFLKDTVYTTTPHGILLQSLKSVPIANVLPQYVPSDLRLSQPILDVRTKPISVGYEWLTPSAQVCVREYPKMPDLVGFWGTICFITDNMCVIYLHDRNEVIYLSHGQIEPIAPVRGNPVKIVMGPDEGKIGVLFSIYNDECIVKYSNDDIKIMPSNYICKSDLIPEIVINYIGKLTALFNEVLQL